MAAQVAIRRQMDDQLLVANTESDHSCEDDRLDSTGGRFMVYKIRKRFDRESRSL